MDFKELLDLFSGLKSKESLVPLVTTPVEPLTTKEQNDVVGDSRVIPLSQLSPNQEESIPLDVSVKPQIKQQIRSLKKETGEKVNVDSDPLIDESKQQEPSTKISTDFDKYKTLLDQYKQLISPEKISEAQKEYKEGMRNAMIMSAASGLSRAGSLAGGKDIGDNEQFVKMMEKQASLPIEEILTSSKIQEDQMKKLDLAEQTATLTEQADPKSDVSNLARLFAKNMLVKSGISGSDLSQLNELSYSQIERLLNTKGLSLGHDRVTRDRNTYASYVDKSGKKVFVPVGSSSSGGMVNMLTGEALPTDAHFYSGTPRIGAGGQLSQYNMSTGELEPLTNVGFGKMASSTELTDLKTTDPQAYTQQINRSILTEPKEVRQDVEKVKKEFNKNLIPLMANQTQLNMLKEKLSGHSSDQDFQIPEDYRAFITKQLGALAQAASTGRFKVTEQEAKAFQGKAGLLAQVNRLMNQASGGNIPKADIEMFKGVSDVLQRSQKQDFEDKTTAAVSSLRKIPFVNTKINADDAKLILNADTALPIYNRPTFANSELLKKYKKTSPQNKLVKMHIKGADKVLEVTPEQYEKMQDQDLNFEDLE